MTSNTSQTAVVISACTRHSDTRHRSQHQQSTVNCVTLLQQHHHDHIWQPTFNRVDLYYRQTDRQTDRTQCNTSPRSEGNGNEASPLFCSETVSPTKSSKSKRKSTVVVERNYELVKNDTKMMEKWHNVNFPVSTDSRTLCSTIKKQPRSINVNSPLSLSLSLSLRFNGHFPGEPGLAGVY